MLADAAQAADGKLNILGGGWNFTGPQVGPMALALMIEVPWHEANRQHHVVVELQDSDGLPARVGPENQAVRFEADIEVGRPPGHPAGTPFNVPMAFNLSPMPLVPGNRYVWKVTIDTEENEYWQIGFQVRPLAGPPPVVLG